jgi:hypothetical protein
MVSLDCANNILKLEELRIVKSDVILDIFYFYSEKV